MSSRAAQVFGGLLVLIAAVVLFGSLSDPPLAPPPPFVPGPPPGPVAPAPPFNAGTSPAAPPTALTPPPVAANPPPSASSPPAPGPATPSPTGPAPLVPGPRPGTPPQPGTGAAPPPKMPDAKMPDAKNPDAKNPSPGKPPADPTKGRLEVTCVDHEGKPVANARVLIDETEAAADGNGLCVQELPAKIYGVGAAAPGYLASDKANETVAAGRTSATRRTLAPLATCVAGRAHDDSGRGVVGGLVTVAARVKTSSGANLSAKTDDQGRFAIGPISNVPYLVKVTAPGWLTLIRDGAVLTPGTDLDLQLERGALIRTSVKYLDKAGATQPAAAAKVSVVRPGSDTQVLLEEWTDAEGRALLSVPAGEVEIVAVPAKGSQQAGTGRTRTKVGAGDDVSLDVVMRADGPMVRGRLVATNTPFEQLQLLFRSPGLNGSWVEGHANSEGHFETQLHWPGKWNFVIMRAAQGTNLRLLDQELEVPEAGLTFDVPLPAMVSVKGKALRANGDPAPDATVYVEGPHAWWKLACAADGAFEVQGLETQTMTVWAELGTLATSVVRFDVKAPPAALELRLATGAKVQGRLATADGQGVENVELWLYPAPNGAGRSCSATTQKDGRFSFENVPPRRWYFATNRGPIEGGDAFDVAAGAVVEKAITLKGK